MYDMLTHVGFDTGIELLEVIDVAAEDLDVLQAVLLAGGAPEGKHRRTPLQPPHMHLHPTQALTPSLLCASGDRSYTGLLSCPLVSQHDPAHT